MRRSRRTRWCSGPATCWCGSGRSASTPCAGTWPSTAMWCRKGRRTSTGWSRWSRTRTRRCPSARGILQVLVRTLNALKEQLKELDGEITRRAKADPVARRLRTIPGIGPIAATAITALVPAPEGFRAGRDFAAWLGLTPLQRSTGGKRKLGAISKMGERTIRRLLILGASAVVRWAGQRGAAAGSWLARMLPRKPRMLVTVALANKTARIVWALLVKGGTYRAPAVAA